MRFRRPLTITSRTSSITDSFVQAIVPSIEPSAEEREEALRVLGMSLENISCVYCGTKATDWDHLRPLVGSKRPTGYINEIRNLVPSCGPCNQSKSGADWRAWMQSNARGAPNTKGVQDLDARKERLERFEKWGHVEPLPLRELAGEESWVAYWAALDAIVEKMTEAQVHAVRLREVIRSALESQRCRESRTKAP
jgi:hypothetical protein